LPQEPHLNFATFDQVGGAWSDLDAGGLIERDRELGQLADGLRAAAEGQGSVLLVSGPPGIGKTTLLDAAQRRAVQAGFMILTARGGELETHFPYGVARQLFEPALRHAPAAERAELLAGAAAFAAPLVAGESGPPATGGSGPASEFGPLHGLHWLTVNMSARAPLLIAVDDAHWADAHSLRFLLYLARRLDGLPVLLLISARSGEQGADPEVWTQLTTQPFVRFIRPGALSEHAVATMLEVGLKQPPAGSFTAACRAATGGTPFLVHELIAALAADQVRPDAESAARVQRVGPRTVATATLVRLARMPPGSVALAQAAAVLAEEAPLYRAARLARLPETEALPALDGLVGAHVLREGTQLRFVHPIVRAAIYDDLPPGERSRLHREAARLLTDEGAEIDAVAAQLLASEPAGSPEVIEQLRQAAAGALSRGAPEDAVAYLTRALREGSGRELRARLSFELGMAEQHAGKPAMIGHFQDAQRLSADRVLRNTAALELASMLALTGQWEEPIAVTEAALADLGESAPDLSLRLERLRAATLAYDPRLVDRFDKRLPELHEMIRTGGSAARLLALLLAAIAALRGRPEHEVVELVRQGWGQGRLVGTGTEVLMRSQGLAALVMTGELRYAADLNGELLDCAQSTGSLVAFLLATSYRGWIEARHGRLATAEGEFRAALEPAREHQLHFVLPSLLWFATDVMAERPEADDLAAVAESVPLGPMAQVASGALLMDARGRARHAAGDTPGGITDLRQAGEIFRVLHFRNPNASSWRSALALMLGADDHAEALRLVREELEDARQVGQPRGIGAALRALGLIEGGTAGREHLSQAEEVLRHDPARLEHARALVDLGAAMRRGGERAASRGPLRAGLDLAVTGGATRLAGRARTELATAGARPRRLHLTGRDALTPSELRVAVLAGGGRTNNEVAQALFITPKTVDTHLMNAYAKLGISSRRDLAAALGVSKAAG
jgi:DNA-binding CsgD family transcriptional regulator/tetratricopeptide (TPR) repeat protein